jgi:hypothetical protein
LNTKIRNADGPNFALFAQLFQGSYGFGQRNLAAGPMNLIQVDGVGLKALQAAFACLPQGVARQVSAAGFSGNHSLIPPP